MKPKTATKIMLYLITAVILFHICIVLRIVPYEITWGGRLQNESEMYIFEAISIAINLFLISILLIKGEYFRAFISMKIINVLLWIFFVLFGLNTVGNILAETNFEKSFTILTLAFSILIWIILRKNKPSPTIPK
jgi:hypothetical protein